MAREGFDVGCGTAAAVFSTPVSRSLYMQVGHTEDLRAVPQGND
jgi:hypothetical protein